MTSVATSLLGRWVKGRFTYVNPDYVSGQGEFFEHTRKQKKELTDYQMTYYVWRAEEGEIVAVTHDGKGADGELVFWILIDGKAEPLHHATVMPKGYDPNLR